MNIKPIQALLPVVMAGVILLAGCNGQRNQRSDVALTFDYGYLQNYGYEYATQYLQLPDNELIRQDFLLGVKARAFKLRNEVSPTHADIFEKAFADSVGIK